MLPGRSNGVTAPWWSLHLLALPIFVYWRIRSLFNGQAITFCPLFVFRKMISQQDTYALQPEILLLKNGHGRSMLPFWRSSHCTYNTLFKMNTCSPGGMNQYLEITG